MEAREARAMSHDGHDRLDSSADARDRMVRRQLERRGVGDARVLAAMRTVPRHEFMPEADIDDAYGDYPWPIGEGQTISQPYIVALMLELLQAGPEDRVLEVGAGSGYQAAVLGELAAEVYAIELIETLARRAAATVQRLGYENVHIVVGDGSEGYEPGAPYDRIVCAAATPQVPHIWEEQLSEGGRIVAPVGSLSLQTCVVVEKRDGKLYEHDSIGCVFVPLLGKNGFSI